MKADRRSRPPRYPLSPNLARKLSDDHLQARQLRLARTATYVQTLGVLVALATALATSIIAVQASNTSDRASQRQAQNDRFSLAYSQLSEADSSAKAAGISLLTTVVRSAAAKASSDIEREDATLYWNTAMDTTESLLRSTATKPNPSDPPSISPETNLASVTFSRLLRDKVDYPEAIVSRVSVDLSNTVLGPVSWRDLDTSDMLIFAARADLRGARLDDARIGRRTTFRDSHFQCSSLKGATIEGDLTGADFRGADLSGADLRNAKLTSTDFTGANVSGVKLSGALPSNVKGFDAQSNSTRSQTVALSTCFDRFPRNE